MDQPARKRPRHRPLETCGATLLAMLNVLYTRTLNKTLKKPASYLVQKLVQTVIFFVSMTSPFHRPFLAMVFIADDHILAVQEAVETYFPSSTFLFLKISDSLTIAESLPQKVDGFLEKLPSLMNRVSWLDWLLIHVIAWLDTLVNVLGRWRDNNKGTKEEKEITVDRSFSRSGSISEEEERKLGAERKRATYKEALQRGSSGEGEGEDGGGSSGGGSSRGDPILELFENGWIQKPVKRSSKSADSLTFSRCDSLST